MEREGNSELSGGCVAVVARRRAQEGHSYALRRSRVTKFGGNLTRTNGAHSPQLASATRTPASPSCRALRPHQLQDPLDDACIAPPPSGLYTRPLVGRPIHMGKAQVRLRIQFDIREHQWAQFGCTYESPTARRAVCAALGTRLGLVVLTCLGVCDIIWCVCRKCSRHADQKETDEHPGSHYAFIGRFPCAVMARGSTSCGRWGRARGRRALEHVFRKFQPTTTPAAGCSTGTERRHH